MADFPDDDPLDAIVPEEKPVLPVQLDSATIEPSPWTVEEETISDGEYVQLIAKAAELFLLSKDVQFYRMVNTAVLINTTSTSAAEITKAKCFIKKIVSLKIQKPNDPLPSGAKATLSVLVNSMDTAAKMEDVKV